MKKLEEKSSPKTGKTESVGNVTGSFSSLLETCLADFVSVPSKNFIRVVKSSTLVIRRAKLITVVYFLTLRAVL